jgi:hypothetical protein
MEFSLRFSITKEEFADFNVYSAWLAPEQKKLRLKTFISTLVLTIGFAVLGIFISRQLSATAGKAPLFSLFNIITAFGVAFLVTVITYRRVAPRTRLKAIQVVEKEENRYILSEAEMEFREDGFTHADSKSRSVQTWQSIAKVADVNHSFYLYMNTIQGFIIPKRVFGSKEEIGQFKKLLEEKIPLSSSFRSIGI